MTDDGDAPALPSRMDKLTYLLAEWEAEKTTNRHGMAYLANRAIKLLKKDIERLHREDS